ncbi:hypothetical protein [Amycolatopsis marina]|nr:hypothetical protein [Amycolatopsis marina]
MAERIRKQQGYDEFSAAELADGLLEAGYVQVREEPADVRAHVRRWQS